MLPIFDELTGERINAEMVRSQEFITGRSTVLVSEGVVELSDRTIRHVRVLRKPDMHGNFRVAVRRHNVDFDTALGSLKFQLRVIGVVTQVMPAYKAKEED
jgi:hypothetical protein